MAKAIPFNGPRDQTSTMKSQYNSTPGQGRTVFIDRLGITPVSGPTAKTGYTASWPVIVKGVLWAAERSPDLRRFLRSALAEMPADETVAPSEIAA